MASFRTKKNNNREWVGKLLTLSSFKNLASFRLLRTFSFGAIHIISDTFSAELETTSPCDIWWYCPLSPLAPSVWRWRDIFHCLQKHWFIKAFWGVILLKKCPKMTLTQPPPLPWVWRIIWMAPFDIVYILDFQAKKIS